MKKTWTLILTAGLLLASCISISSGRDAPTPAPQFVTSTLPPTKSFVSLPSRTPPTSQATAATPSTAVPTEPSNCTNVAVLMEDVTIPDDTRLEAGKAFTKTWRFKNTGSCHWSSYTIHFFTGDRMGAPDSAPIPDTLAGSTVDVSVELTAPAANGSYSGYFTLKTAEGDSILIGTEKTFWVRIIVGGGTASTAAPTARPGMTSTAAPATNSSPGSCDFSENAGYIGQIQSLINAERLDHGLPALGLSTPLSAAAQGHSIDMACNSLLSHSGSNGSTVSSRIAAAGYSASYSEEIIYAGGDAQTAFAWWMNDAIHRDAILNPKSTEMGIGYAYAADSAYGGYFTVDFASP
ncbi:MAG: NBR1-Ig-like domain-containing protein [Chloroflexota bacterium]